MTSASEDRARRARSVRSAVSFGFLALVFLSLSVRANVAGEPGTFALIIACVFAALAAYSAGKAAE